MPLHEQEAAVSDMANNQGEELKKYSCVRCFLRKVKCDKRIPCSHCSRQSSDCVYRAPAPPVRRKRTNSSTNETIGSKRVQSIQEVTGLSPVLAGNLPVPSETTGNHPAGTAISTAGIANPLWVGLSEDMSRPYSYSSEEEDDTKTGMLTDLVFGTHQTNSSIRHPCREITLRLWKLFKDNIDPLTKIIHVPTIERHIEDFFQGTSTIPREIDVLLFAIYSAALYSISDSLCLELFQQEREEMLTMYCANTRTRLAEMNFVSTASMTVLQAFLLYLIAMRATYDGRTMWILSGIGVRIAQSLRLQVDGTVSGLSAFDTELQRRVWYHIAMSDMKFAEFAGVEKMPLFGDGPTCTKKFSNNNDEDLVPSMKEIPPDSKKITSISFVRMRADMTDFWRTNIPGSLSILGGVSRELSGSESHDPSVDWLEEHLRESYTKYCTPTIPIHLMIAIVSTHAVDIVRFIKHHPKSWANSDAGSESERQFVWHICMRSLHAFVTCHTTPALAGFRWHMFSSFPWQQVVHVLDCLQHDRAGEESDDAWELIQKIYATHPHFLTQRKRPVHVAVGRLVLKAFETRSRSYADKGKQIQVPDFVAFLRSTERSRNERRQRGSRSRETPLISPSETDAPYLNTPPTSALGSSSLEDQTHDAWADVDWDEWGKLVKEWEGNLATVLQ